MKSSNIWLLIDGVFKKIQQINYTAFVNSLENFYTSEVVNRNKLKGKRVLGKIDKL